MLNLNTRLFAIDLSEQALRLARKRKRERIQKQCHEYWVRTYGAQAEYASRGGVTWFG